MAEYRINLYGGVIRLADSAVIPADPGNGDWRAYQAWLAAGNIPEPAEQATPSAPISDRQFFQALANAGAISEAEALAAVKTGDIPAALQVVVNALSPEQKFVAEMLLSGATIFERYHPMTMTIAAAMQWTEQQVDELWQAASQL